MPRFSATLLVPLLFLSINAFPQQRTLEISGLRNYTENELFEILNLNRYEEGTMTAKEVADTIITFYSEKGFSLVKVYVIENSETVLKIYVDEGALGKIIFLNMDDFSTIYLKIVFWFKNKIFNVNTVNENIEKLKKGKRWKEITYQLKPVKEYDTSIFQLDRALDLPLIGKKQLPFFDTYSPRFDLLVIFSKSDIPDSIIDTTDSKGGSGPKDRKKGKKLVFNKFNYGLKVHFYKGFIPYLKYYQLGLISNRDFFMGETSVGIMYGIDRKFKRPPRETYFHLNLNYFFTPTFKDIFTPLIRADLYQSKSARPDLGLLEYNFLILNTMLAPGITLLRKFNLYTGFGVETAFFFNSKLIKLKLLKYDRYRLIFGKNVMKQLEDLEDILRLYREIDRRTDVYNYCELGFIYDFTKRSNKIYELRKNRLKKEIALIYDFYFLKKTFNRVRVLGYFDHEFKDRGIYSGILSYQFTFNDPPFYQEISVSNPAFKGFNGLSYFSRNVLSQSNEYRISIYQDFLYIGVFFDMTLFEGSGRDVDGAQFGIVGGPTGRILLLDHFELYLQYGWDFLVSTKRNQGYLYFNIYNKW